MLEDIIGIVKDVTGIVAGTTSQANANNGGTSYNVGKGINDATALISLKNRALSISEQARKSIMVYPVLVSTSVGDATIAQNITKYLEIQYAVFTLLTIGINHDMANTNVRDQLMKISAESLDCTNLASDPDFKKCAEEAYKEYNFNDRQNTGARIGAGLKSTEGVQVQDVDSDTAINYVYKMIDEDPSTTLSEKLKLKAAVHENYVKDQAELEKDKAEWTKAKSDDNIYKDKQKYVPGADNNVPPPLTHPEDPDKYTGKKYTNDKVFNTYLDYYLKLAKYVGAEVANGTYYGNQKDVYKKGQMTASSAAMEKAMSEMKASPTIVKINFKLGGTNDIEIPIAIKAAMHPIGGSEMRSLLESGLEGKMPSIRVAKALSGEIRMVRDLIFNMDIADRDQKLYKTLGRHPWYQRLQERKMKSKFNIFTKAMTSVNSVLPTSSLIVTKDDLVLSTRIGYNQFLKNEKLMKNILDAMFLLSIGVYEPELEQVSFFFSGFRDPFVFGINEIAKGKDNTNQLLMESLNNLSRKV